MPGRSPVGQYVSEDENLGCRSRIYWNTCRPTSAGNGYEVSVLERDPWDSETWKGKVRVFLGDRRQDREAVIEAISQQDGVINLAGILGTMETLDNPRPSVDTNIHGALNTFEGCCPNSMNPNGVKGVQISVGNHFMNNTYSIMKTTAERFALMFNKEHETKIAVVRGLNAYGDYQKHKPIKKITPNFIVKALNQQPIAVFGDLEQIMDMIYARDIAAVLVRALTLEHNCYHTVFEAGTGRCTSVNMIRSKIVNEQCGSKAGIKYLPMRAGEPERSVVLGNPETLKPLGLSARDLTPLESGLERTIRWYRDHYDWKL